MKEKKKKFRDLTAAQALTYVRVDGKHLGKRIPFESLNADCQKLIIQEFQ